MSKVTYCECDLIDSGNGTKIPVCKYCGRPLSPTIDCDVAKLDGIGTVIKLYAKCYTCDKIQYYYVDCNIENRFTVNSNTKEEVIESEISHED